MAYILLHNDENGNLIITTPTVECLNSHGIDWIKEKDTPDHSVILDDSVLPKDKLYFRDAYVFDGVETVTIDLDKAKAIHLKNFNLSAAKVAQKRQSNTMIGLENTPDDATWIASLTAGRNAIAEATAFEQLLEITLPS